MQYTIQLSAANTSHGVVTLGAQFVALRSVEQIVTGDFASTADIAPVTYTVVSVAPTTTTQVQLTAPGQLTFESTTALNTTYGTLVIQGAEVGAQPVVGPRVSLP